MNTENKENTLRRSLRAPKPNTSRISDCSDGQKNMLVKPKIPKKDDAMMSSKKASEDASAKTKAEKIKVLKAKVTGNSKVIKKNMNEKTTNVAAGRICNKKFLRKPKNRRGHFIIDCDEIVQSIRINVDDLKKYLKGQVKAVEEEYNGHVEIEVKKMKIFIDTDFYIDKSRFKLLTKKYLKKKKLHNWIRVVAGKNKYVLRYFTIND